jgi:hypothetical protein
MLGFEAPGGGPMPSGPAPPNPFAAAAGTDDPFAALLSQFGAGVAGPGFGGLPNMQAQQQPEQAEPNPYAYIWRVVHAVFALGLGLYIALGTTFRGTKPERDLAATLYTPEDDRRNFIWVFATAEALLLTARFFMDRGRSGPTGVVGMVVGFLPEPFKGYLSVVLRYGQIFSTVRSDILVCVFVLGVCSWIRSI